MAKNGSNTVGVTFKADGEKEFKQSLSEINAGLKVNSSELQLLSAEYANNADSTEALTAKSKALQNQIFSQTEKVKKLEEALKASATQNGEADKKTLDWQTSLNKAKADLAKMNNELAENKKALDASKTSTSSLGDVVRGLASTVGVDIPPAMQGMVTKLDGVSASGAALVGVLGGIVVGLGKLTVQTSHTADDILTLSSTSGMTTDKIQELKYSAELLDTSFETIDSSTTKLIKSMDSAKDKTTDQAEAFHKLHINAIGAGGQLRDGNEVFYETIDALGKITNETERDSISMILLGKSARDLNPLIEAGSEKLKDLGVEAHNVGYVMSEETLGKFGKLDDAMQRMTTKGETLKNSLALALLPILTKLFEVIGSIPVPVLQTIIVLASVVTTVILAVKAIKELTGTAGAIKGFFSGMDTATLKTTAIIIGVVAVFIALLAVIAAITGKAGQVESTMDSIGNSIGNMKSSATSTLSSVSTNRLPHYAKGTSFHEGGLAVVGEDGAEVVDLPRGSKVYPHNSKINGGDTYIINVDAKNVKEFNDMVRIAQNQKQSQRMGYVGG